MAGIGVKLNKIYRKNTITTNIVGFFLQHGRNNRPGSCCNYQPYVDAVCP